MKVEVLYFKGCPNHLPTVERVGDILNETGLHHEVREIEVDTYEKAEASRFLGSPSVRINGVDIEPSARDARVFGLTCRTYVDGATRSGLPSRELISEAITEQMGAHPHNTAPNANQLQSRQKTGDGKAAAALVCGRSSAQDVLRSCECENT